MVLYTFVHTPHPSSKVARRRIWPQVTSKGGKERTASFQCVLVQPLALNELCTGPALHRPVSPFSRRTESIHKFFFYIGSSLTLGRVQYLLRHSEVQRIWVIHDVLGGLWAMKIKNAAIFCFTSFLYALLAVPAASLALKSYFKIYIILCSRLCVSGHRQKCFLLYEQLQPADLYGIKNRSFIFCKWRQHRIKTAVTYSSA